MLRWSQKSRLDAKREEAISSITGKKIDIELMAQRSRPVDDLVDQDLLGKVLSKIAQIEASARAANSTTELDDLIADGESQWVANAYFCPANEISYEGNRVIDNLELWGIPKTSISKLRETFRDKLGKSPEIGRAALHAIFIELDEWSDYIDEYEDTMRAHTLWLFSIAAVLLISGGILCYFANRHPIFMWFSLIATGAAGSLASVLAKMPPLDLSLSGELSAYGRRIWSRIAVGTIASLIGFAFLGWGILPIAIKNQTLSDALNACSTSGSTSCTMPKMLIVLGVVMLLGFSERTLTSVEQRLFSDSPKRATKHR